MKTPDFLQKGDQVALLAPAGFINDETPILLAEKLLKSWGLTSIRGKYLLKKNAYLAGNDTQRLEDFQSALDNPSIKAIWAIRGGYGSMRLLPDLNFDKFQKNPKWIIGFSDITAFHIQIHSLGYKSLHALMPVQLTEDNLNSKVVTDLRHALFGENIDIIIPASTKNKTGSATEVLVGGNLSIIESLLGTPFQLKTKGKILFIEEVGEPLYKIDRLLTSLKMAGVFKQLKGLVVGAFTEIDKDKPDDKIYQDLILEIIKEYDYPVLFNFPAGHVPANHCLVLGETVTLNVGEFVSCIRAI